MQDNNVDGIEKYDPNTYANNMDGLQWIFDRKN